MSTAAEDRTVTASGRFRSAFEPVGRTLFSEPFEQGRLRLDGLAGLERTLAVGALVVLIGLLLALLVGGAFRHATLIRLNDSDNRWTFVPLTLLPMAFVALFAGWLVFLWGALRGSVWVALLGAFVHLLINGTIGVVSGGIGDSFVNNVMPTVNRVGYFATAGVMVVFALLRLKRSWDRPLRFVAFPLLAAALAAMYGAALLLAIDAVRHGFPALATLVLDGNIEGISGLLEPMILLAAVALVDFSYNLSNAVGSPAMELRAQVAKAILAAIVAVKLWVLLFSHWDVWTTYARISSSGVIWVVVGAAAFAAVGLWWRSALRRRALGEAGEERVKERIVYIGIVAEILPSLIVIVLTTAASTIAAQANSRGAVRWLDSVERFTFHHSTVVRAIPWVVLLLAGIWLVARGRTASHRELGLGLLLLGAWNTPFYVLGAFGVRFEFSNALLDIVITIGIGIVLIARWRRIDRFEASALVVITLFTWLAFSRGDFITAIANGPLGFLGLPAAVLVVFGIAYTLLADSAIASGSNRSFPRDTRVLLYLGFLVLSTAVLVWLDTTHVTSNLQGTVSSNGFADIGIPFAAWLVIRRPLTRREAVDTALPSEAAAFEVDELEAPPQFEA
jgi:hypothetical protein